MTANDKATPPTLAPRAVATMDRTGPEDEASVVSKTTFAWVQPILALGNKQVRPSPRSSPAPASFSPHAARAEGVATGRPLPT